MVSSPRNPCNTTSVEYFSTPAWSVHLRVCSAPSMYTLAPFFRYCSATLQSGSEKITTRCHSVFSLRSPVALSRQVSDVAMLKLAIGRPSCVRRISGSLPRFPTRITLFTLPAIAVLHSKLLGLAGHGRRFSARQLCLGMSCYLRRPYTLAAAADLAIPRQSLGYPHIASPAPMFQFCSTPPRALPIWGILVRNNRGGTHMRPQ